MSNKYFSGRNGPYIFCDICGQATYVFEATRLTTETGKGGLVVCKHDADSIDPGLIPYKLAEENPVKFIRINHTNIDNSADPLNMETTTELGV